MAKSLAQLKADAKAEGWADWIRSEGDERAVLDGMWFDVAAGQQWVDFFEKFLILTMGRWAGKEFELLPWQRDGVIMPLFGWKRDRDRPKLRRYRKGDIFVAKKQGKSTLCGGLVNGFLMTGGERAEVYGVAHTREQAGIIYREAAAMAKRSLQLKDRLITRDSQKRILYKKTGGFYQALAGENGAKSAEGIIPVAVIFDEIHVQRDRVLYDALTYALSVHENSLMLSVSTVGVADTTAIWWEQYEYAKGIISGKITDHARFAFVAQADEKCKDDEAARRDPAQWRKAMPSLGETVSEEWVLEQVIEAENSPAKVNSLLRYIFNIPTAQVNKVIPMSKWDACQTEMPDLENRTCYVGFDAASKEDLTAAVAYFPPLDEEERGWLISRFWCPEAKIREREMKGLAHYGQWVKDDWMQQTPGERIEHNYVAEDLANWLKPYSVVEIAFDPWNADAIVNQLEEAGYPTIEVAQTFVGMSNYTGTFIDVVVKQQIWHDGNPVMGWCCSNAATEEKFGDAQRFAKGKSADKIDGVIAGAMAVGRGMLTAEHVNFYEDNELEMA